MASASDGFQPGSRPSEETRAEDVVTRLAHGELLDRILEETILGERDDGRTDLRLLRQVAARYPKAAFSLTPVAVELVQAAIGPSYRELLDSQDAWEAMTQGIAQTLFDDPRSRQRLELLWSRLQEAPS